MIRLKILIEVTKLLSAKDSLELDSLAKQKATYSFVCKHITRRTPRRPLWHVQSEVEYNHLTMPILVCYKNGCLAWI